MNSDSQGRIESFDTQISSEYFFKVLSGSIGRIAGKMLNIAIYLACSEIFHENDFLDQFLQKLAKLFKLLLSFIDENMSAVELSKLYQNMDSIYHIFIGYLSSSKDSKSKNSVAMK